MHELSRLKKGSAGRVVRIHGTDSISMRLLEMGLTPGVSVKMIGAAFLGDPLEIELRGYHLSVRKSEASRVEVAGS
ncbi:MAG: ferrous iron transport protein A [Planctomycetaceae bacterium]|nr:MAG: ferrous iron transport protein A [Planctomycetaceae bacterium]